MKEGSLTQTEKLEITLILGLAGYETGPLTWAIAEKTRFAAAVLPDGTHVAPFGNEETAKKAVAELEAAGFVVAGIRDPHGKGENLPEGIRPDHNGPWVVITGQKDAAEDVPF